jgi:O-antigen/teichoic acid export membrane protein
MAKSQIKIGSVLSYLQLFCSIAIGLAYTPIMIRLLGKSEYGLYNTVSSTISIMSLLSLGFNAGYLRYYTKYIKEDNKESIYKLNGLFLIVFLIIGVIAFLCGIFLTYHLDWVFNEGLTTAEYETAKILMFILTINLAVSFPMSVFSNIINAHERFVFLKLLGIFKTIGGPLTTLPLLLIGYRSIAMVIVTASLNLIIDIFYLIYVLCVLKQKFLFHGFEKGIFKSIFAYTSLIAVHLIVDQINWNVDKILLGRFRGTSDVAVYSVGYSLYTYYLAIGLPLAGLFIPRIHKIIANTQTDHIERKRGVSEIFIKVGRIQFFILGLIATGVIFFGKPFIAYWAGVGYEDAYYVALLLIIPGTIDLIQNLGIEIQRAENLHKFRAIIYLIMALINVAISIVLCQRYGAIGSAIGTAISLILVQGIIINIYYQKKCNIDIIAFWKNILRMSIGMIIPVVCGILMMRFIHIQSIWVLLGCVLIYASIYAISMWFLGINQYEKNLLKKPLKKVFKK